jgi:hypothetical protein
MTMGWFPTPLASATDGGATQIGARSQRLMPIIPEDRCEELSTPTRTARRSASAPPSPSAWSGRWRCTERHAAAQGDLYRLTRPKFPDEQATGGIQVTAFAEGARPDDGGVSPMFRGQMRQLLNGVDLPSGRAAGHVGAGRDAAARRQRRDRLQQRHGGQPEGAGDAP